MWSLFPPPGRRLGPPPSPRGISVAGARLASREVRHCHRRASGQLHRGLHTGPGGLCWGRCCRPHLPPPQGPCALGTREGGPGQWVPTGRCSKGLASPHAPRGSLVCARVSQRLGTLRPAATHAPHVPAPTPTLAQASPRPSSPSRSPSAGVWGDGDSGRRPTPTSAVCTPRHFCFKYFPSSSESFFLTSRRERRLCDRLAPRRAGPPEAPEGAVRAGAAPRPRARV